MRLLILVIRSTGLIVFLSIYSFSMVLGKRCPSLLGLFLQLLSETRLLLPSLGYYPLNLSVLYLFSSSLQSTFKCDQVLLTTFPHFLPPATTLALLSFKRRISTLTNSTLPSHYSFHCILFHSTKIAVVSSSVPLVAKANGHFSICLFCQPVILGTNSTPTGIPSLGCGEKGNYIQCKQINCDTAWLWGQLNSDNTISSVKRQHVSSAVLHSSLLHSALLCLLFSTWSSLLQWDVVSILSSMFQLQPRKRCLQWKGKSVLCEPAWSS